MHTTMLLALDGSAAETTSETTNPNDYRPVGDQAELQSPGTLVVTAYALIWIILFVFVVLAYLRTSALGERLRVIEAALARRPAEPSAPPAAAKAAKPAPTKEASGSHAEQAETEG